MVLKGKVCDIFNGGASVTATPYGGGVVTTQLTVPQSLRGALSVNTPILYAAFEDNTGIVLSRMDGVDGSSGFYAVADGDAIIISTNNIPQVEEG